MSDEPKNETLGFYQTKSVEFLTGAFSGLIVAALLNPWDKALYLSVLENRPFLTAQNFRHPFQGVSQTILQRALSHGCYFPLERLCIQFIEHTLDIDHDKDDHNLQKNPVWIASMGGTLAGAINGLVMNPIAAVKYTRWNDPRQRGLIREVKYMVRHGGLGQLTKGTWSTICRDCIFGSVFSSLRHWQRSRLGLKQPWHQRKNNEDNNSNDSNNHSKKTKKKANRLSTSQIIWIDANSAFLATMLSSPLNYVRNIQYSIQPKSESSMPGTVSVLKDLYTEGLIHSRANGEGLWSSMKFWRFKLRIGWGTARVSCGMALTSLIWEMSHSFLN